MLLSATAVGSELSSSQGLGNAQMKEERGNNCTDLSLHLHNCLEQGNCSTEEADRFRSEQISHPSSSCHWGSAGDREPPARGEQTANKCDFRASSGRDVARCPSLWIWHARHLELETSRSNEQLISKLAIRTPPSAFMKISALTSS